MGSSPSCWIFSTAWRSGWMLADTSMCSKALPILSRACREGARGARGAEGAQVTYAAGRREV